RRRMPHTSAHSASARRRMYGRRCVTSSVAPRRAERKEQVMDKHSAARWQSHITQLEALARSQGLHYHPVEFEVVPESFMTEIAIYGLPVRMPHWSFGVRYIYQLIQHRMGLSRLFEVVFPGNPGRAYLARSNSDAENVLVTAHVLGHADFSANNMLFTSSQRQVGGHIVEQAAAHARQIGQAIEEHGLQR